MQTTDKIRHYLVSEQTSPNTWRKFLVLMKIVNIKTFEIYINSDFNVGDVIETPNNKVYVWKIL